MRREADLNRQRGFSLVEVLCAVAIAAAAIAALMNGMWGALRGAAAIDQRLGARIILESILQDELSAAATAPATREGESGSYRWRLDISPASPDAKLPAGYGFYRLSASVRWGTGGEVSGSVLKLTR